MPVMQVLARRGLLRSACRLGLRQQPATLTRAFGGGHGDPRGHLNPDGTRPEMEDAEDYHDPDPIEHTPKQLIFTERGQRWIKSNDPPKSFEELHGIPQDDKPFFPRSRLFIWANYKLLMKAEYLFFYIPTVIILGLCIPAFTT